MAEKIPGKPRKSTSSRKKETAEKTAQNSSTVTPIDQAVVGQSGTTQGQGRQSQGPSQSGTGQDRISSTFGQSSSQSGAHPSADLSGAGKSSSASTFNQGPKQGGGSPSILNPSGSVQEGRHAAGVRPSGQELQERIRARAYELFEQRGRQEGFDQEDWARAEAEVLAEFEREKSA